MHGSLRWLTLILILAGCREPRSRAAGAEAPEVAATPNDGGSGQAEPGVEFEAPRLIPGSGRRWPRSRVLRRRPRATLPRSRTGWER